MSFEYEAMFVNGRLIEIQPISICRNGAGGPPEVFYPPPHRAVATETETPEQGSNDS
jgi:hypothetical protein